MKYVGEFERNKAFEDLISLFELCINANNGAWTNGVTDQSGSIDEGDCVASDRICAARKALLVLNDHFHYITSTRIMGYR